MGTKKIKCPKCKRMGTLRLREKGKNALVMSHYDHNLYKKNKNKGTRSCYIGSCRRPTRELFLKYTIYDKQSPEYIAFEQEIGKIRNLLLNTPKQGEIHLATEQETMVGILYNLVKLHTFEKRMFQEAKDGIEWTGIKCKVCNTSHTIKVFARKRRTTYLEHHLGQPYLQWKLSSAAESTWQGHGPNEYKRLIYHSNYDAKGFHMFNGLDSTII